MSPLTNLEGTEIPIESISAAIRPSSLVSDSCFGDRSRSNSPISANGLPPQSNPLGSPERSQPTSNSSSTSDITEHIHIGFSLVTPTNTKDIGSNDRSSDLDKHGTLTDNVTDLLYDMTTAKTTAALNASSRTSGVEDEISPQIASRTPSFSSHVAQLLPFSDHGEEALTNTDLNPTFHSDSSYITQSPNHSQPLENLDPSPQHEGLAIESIERVSSPLTSSPPQLFSSSLPSSQSSTPDVEEPLAPKGAKILITEAENDEEMKGIEVTERILPLPDLLDDMPNCAPPYPFPGQIAYPTDNLFSLATENQLQNDLLCGDQNHLPQETLALKFHSSSLHDSPPEPHLLIPNEVSSPMNKGPTNHTLSHPAPGPYGCDSAEAPQFSAPPLLNAKRKADDDTIESDETHATLIEDNVQSRLPNPKRPTLAAHKLQLKKLAKPFRSPVLKRAKVDGPDIPLPQSNQSPICSKIDPNASGNPLSQVLVSKPVDRMKQYRTQRVAAQFKSPLVTDTPAKLSSVRMTPTIRELERKVQLLKRAVKVKQDGDEETLRGLVHKWTEAGREVAWEVWALVKDNEGGEDRGNTGTRGWDWGEKDSKMGGRSWGWDDGGETAGENGVTAVEGQGALEGNNTDDCDEEKKQDTVGTMLMQLGIAPETLGWNEEDGTFQDR